MGTRNLWRGRVIKGHMKGYEVEIRASGRPLPVYVIAYRHRPGEASSMVCFAVGTEALRQHFLALDVRVLWDEPRRGDRRDMVRPGRRPGSSRSRWRPLEAGRPESPARSVAAPGADS